MMVEQLWFSHFKVIHLDLESMDVDAHLSSCKGLTYPAAKMLRDKMFGSIMFSSPSGVLRRRPGKRQVSHWEQLWQVLMEMFIFKGKKSKKKSNLPTTSSRISFHSMSPPDSCTMVTAILLWRPCSTATERTCTCFLSECWKHFRYCEGRTWCSRKVPWHGMPPLWSTTAGM